MSMRDKIAKIAFEGTHDSSFKVADAILASLPDMVKPLVWDGLISGPYHIEIGNQGCAVLKCYSEVDEYGDVDVLQQGFLELVSVEDHKAAANAHHVATIMAAFGEGE